MWSYYGSKSKVIRHYPDPKFGKIIEPFAGTAKYSLKYFERDVLLVDKYEKIVDLWKYMQNASEKDILDLPDVEYGDELRDHKLDYGASLLMGFSINRGSSVPKNKVAKFQNWNTFKVKVAKSLYKIRHWEIRLGTYTDIGNQKATWFIDPPYQTGGKYYVHSKIDYEHLAQWTPIEWESP